MARSDDLPAEIDGGKIDPIYCLHGEEHFAIDRCVRALRKAIVGREDVSSALNYDVFDLKESGLDTAIAAANTLAMLAPRRLVVGRGIDLVKADALEALIAYVGNPNPKSCLVLLTEKADKVDSRLRAFLALKKAGFLHELRRLSDRELPAFVTGEARRRGFSIDSDAAAALSRAAGPDLGRLASAVDQLGLYAAEPGKNSGKPPVIKREHVETLIPESREHQIYELTRAVGRGDQEAALRLLAAMFRSGEMRPQSMALVLQGSLLRQIRQIWRARELLRAGASPGDLPSALGIPPFAIDEVVGPAERMSSRVLADAFARLYRADRALKSSRTDPELLVSRLVWQLAGAAAPVARPSPRYG